MSDIDNFINEIGNYPLNTIYFLKASQVTHDNEYISKIPFITDPQLYTLETSLLYITQTGYFVEFKNNVPFAFVQYNIIINISKNKLGLYNYQEIQECFIYENTKNLINKIEFDDLPKNSIVYIEKLYEEIDLLDNNHMELVKNYIQDIKNMIYKIDAKINNLEKETINLKIKKESIINQIPNYLL